MSAGVDERAGGAAVEVEGDEQMPEAGGFHQRGGLFEENGGRQAPLRGGARGTGRQVHQWRVTVQGPRANKAHCKRCKTAFDSGEMRLQAARQGRSTDSYFHLRCVDATLPPANEFQGFSDLVLSSVRSMKP